MIDQQKAEAALNRRAGRMGKLGQAKIDKMFNEADDLHWTCPECSTKRTGTLEELKQGCLTCLTQ